MILCVYIVYIYTHHIVKYIVYSMMLYYIEVYIYIYNNIIFYNIYSMMLY